MTNEEFDVLDELYFVQSFEYLVNAVGLSRDKLRSTLRELMEKKWVRCYISPVEEIDFESAQFEKYYSEYYYLASKKGLLAHNSIA